MMQLSLACNPRQKSLRFWPWKAESEKSHVLPRSHRSRDPRTTCCVRCVCYLKSHRRLGTTKKLSMPLIRQAHGGVKTWEKKQNRNLAWAACTAYEGRWCPGVAHGSNQAHQDPRYCKGNQQKRVCGPDDRLVFSPLHSRHEHLHPHKAVTTPEFDKFADGFAHLIDCAGYPESTHHTVQVVNSPESEELVLYDGLLPCSNGMRVVASEKVYTPQRLFSTCRLSV